MKLENLIDIEDDIYTISNKMRTEIWQFFKNKPSLKIVELGAYKGYTTRFLAEHFEMVYAVDNNDSYLEENQEYNNKFRNIEYIKCDVYGSWGDILPVDVDVVLIDVCHSYDSCKSDLDKSLGYFNGLKYIIFDDYGVFPGVRRVVDEAIGSSGRLKFERWVGLTDIPGTLGGYVKGSHEGVICSVNRED